LHGKAEVPAARGAANDPARGRISKGGAPEDQILRSRSGCVPRLGSIGCVRRLCLKISATSRVALPSRSAEPAWQILLGVEKVGDDDLCTCLNEDDEMRAKSREAEGCG